MKKLLLVCAVIIGFAFTASAQDNQKPEFKFKGETRLWQNTTGHPRNNQV